MALSPHKRSTGILLAALTAAGANFHLDIPRKYTRRYDPCEECGNKTQNGRLCFKCQQKRQRENIRRP